MRRVSVCPSVSSLCLSVLFLFYLLVLRVSSRSYLWIISNHEEFNCWIVCSSFVSMLVYNLLVTYWLFVSVIALISTTHPILAKIATYGHRTDRRRAASGTISTFPTRSTLLSASQVPFLSPHWYISNRIAFTAYYVCGTISTIAILVDILLSTSMDDDHHNDRIPYTSRYQFIYHIISLTSFDSHDVINTTTNTTATTTTDNNNDNNSGLPDHLRSPNLSPLLFYYSIYLCHLCRRLYESLFITRFSSTSQQHLIVTIFGIMFYIGAVITPVIDEIYQQQYHPYKSFPSSINMLLCIFGIVCFIISSYWQCICHITLRSLRSNNMDVNNYKIIPPLMNGFQYLVAPHYSAEICIYLSLLCIRPSLLQSLILLWVIVNLSITVKKTQSWYIDQIRTDKYRIDQETRQRITQRRCLIPWIF